MIYIIKLHDFWYYNQKICIIYYIIIIIYYYIPNMPLKIWLKNEDGFIDCNIYFSGIWWPYIEHLTNFRLCWTDGES